MAGEDSDLQFIRCPGCRSLVPAAATRCRMCGQLLEQRRDEDNDQLVKKTRVRQRTMSVSEDEREALKTRAIEDGPEAFEEDGDPFPVEAEQEYTDEEPELPAHVEVRGAQPGEIRREIRPRDLDDTRFDEESSVVADEDDEESDEAFDASSEGDAEDDAAGEAVGDPNGEPGRKKRRRRRRKKKGAQQVQPSEPFAAPPPAAPDPVDPGPRQAPRFGWSRPEHVEAPRAERPRSDWSRPEPERAPQREESRPFRVGQENGRPAHEPRPAPVAEEPRPFIAPRVEPAPVPVREAMREQPRPVEVAPREPAGSETPHRATDGDLIGWLVTPDEYGRSVSRELRVGRYFVSRQRLRPTDIVFENPSISMPQCLLDATAEGVAVQDLMSDRGTFIRRYGTEKFARVENTVQVSHGDTVRFGEFDVLVCLVPRGGSR